MDDEVGVDAGLRYSSGPAAACVGVAGWNQQLDLLTKRHFQLGTLRLPPECELSYAWRFAESKCVLCFWAVRGPE